jgi:hypothetical protein
MHVCIYIYIYVLSCRSGGQQDRWPAPRPKKTAGQQARSLLSGPTRTEASKNSRLDLHKPPSGLFRTRLWRSCSRTPPQLLSRMSVPHCRMICFPLLCDRLQVIAHVVEVAFLHEEGVP